MNAAYLKVTLTQEEASEVVSRWISDYLCSPSVNDKVDSLSPYFP